MDSTQLGIRELDSRWSEGGVGFQGGTGGEPHARFYWDALMDRPPAGSQPVDPRL